jgi:signal transduction histidine kinase
VTRLAKLLNGYFPGNIAANPWVLLALTPLITYFSLEAYYPSANPDVSYVVTVILIAHLVTSVSVIILNVLLRTIKLQKVWLVLTSYLLAGLADSLVLIFGLQVPWIPIGTGLSAWSLVFVAAPVTASWLLMGHLALGLLLTNAKNYGDLLAKKHQLETLTESAQLELRSYKSALQGEIAERIEKMLDQIASRLAKISDRSNPELMLETATAVSELAESDVRMLSHELADAAGIDVRQAQPRARMTWRGFAKFGGDASANIPWVLSVGTLQAISLALAIGDIVTTIVVVVSLAIGFPVLVWFDRIRRKAVTGWPIFLQIVSAPIEYAVLAVIGVQLVRLATVDLASVEPHLNTFLWAVPIGGISIWLMIFLIRGFSKTLELSSQELEKVTNQLGNALSDVRMQLTAARNHMAKILHGSVQGRLASVSLALTATANATNVNNVNELLSQAKTQLDLAKQDLADVFRPDHSLASFDQNIKQLLAGWHGLVEITLKFEDAAQQYIENNPVFISKVIESMRECLTNAVRHGSASEVEFGLRIKNGHLIMIATNQAAIQPVDISPGLGWRHMEDLADFIEMENKSSGFEVRLAWEIPT